ncbi:hypothetical protein ILUMI_21585 [Ignelater luminosus]|uniref:Uncharacterized protein n=1 Tax=Ignelater luminosus TaxID=2038154 RepID=A0A8K0CFZ6_IGNLU|nr:hypothetical protein ILUMI_21585 [Ignelater luminosus]
MFNCQQQQNFNKVACLDKSMCVFEATLNCSHRNIMFLHLHCENPRVLQVLYLNNNNISYIHKTTFKNTTNLRRLDLNDNNISKIEEHTFSGLEKLEYLHLSKNKIREIHKDSFINLQNLLFIDLEDNLLTVINDGTFIRSKALWQVHLARNKINQVHENSFKEKSSLKHLYCSNNEISDITFLKKFPQLTFLDLSLNRIQIIPHMILMQTNLRKLNLSYNNLETLSSGTICDLPVLTDLDLSHNKLKDLGEGPFDHLYGLNTLDLRNNYLTSFSYGVDFGRVRGNVMDIYIDNNNWHCHYLHQIRQLSGIRLKYQNINRNISNIDGIPCSDVDKEFITTKDGMIKLEIRNDQLVLFIIIGVGIMIISTILILTVVLLIRRMHRSNTYHLRDDPMMKSLPPTNQKKTNNKYAIAPIRDIEDEPVYEEIYIKL